MPPPLDHEEIPVLQKEEIAGTQHIMYLAGQRSWNERSSRDREEINRLKLISLGAIAVVLILGVSVAMLSRKQYIPYVVTVNQQGKYLDVKVLAAPASRDVFNQPTVTAVALRDWIIDWRRVSSDPYAVRAFAAHVFSMVDGNGQALPYLRDWFHKNNPLEIAKSKVVQVEEPNVRAVSSGTYLAFWRETVTDVYNPGGKPTIRKWHTTINVKLLAPKDEAEVKGNPFGIWVSTIGPTQRENSEGNDDEN